MLDLLCEKLVIINESASRSIWITTDIYLAKSWIQTHRGRVMQIMKQALYLQATTSGYKMKFYHPVTYTH